MAKGRIKAFSIGGTGSGAGKTTVTLAILAALRRRGLKVQPFKAGPDFIDPGHHQAVSGLPSHNLDTWMLTPQENMSIFQRHAAGCDLALVEGVMGLFDGFGPQDETGSTAHLSKLLGLPVLLVIDAKGMARSLAAVAKGFAAFDPELAWAGVMANQCGSSQHLSLLRQVMAGSVDMPFWGGLTRDPKLIMPERHLGLITAEEGGLGPELLNRLADLMEEGVDLDLLLANLPEVAAAAPPEEPAKARIRLGVARDEAFCFYYRENLRRLRQAGAELVFFSPLRDQVLPHGLHGLYLGGGYPELFAEQLAANQGLRREIAQAARQGLPIYGECGGMIYLGRSVQDLEGRAWPQCGVLPIEVGMNPRLRRLGYREVSLASPTPLGPQGLTARGHEFHYSEIIATGEGAQQGIFACQGRGGAVLEHCGWRVANTVASYLHLHFGSNPQLAKNFVAFCQGAA